MGYKKREVSSLNVYHVGLKGNKSQVIFFDDDDKFYFLKALFNASDEYGVGIAAWVLMNNHVHLLLHGSLAAISSLIQSVSASYVQKFNCRNYQDGKLWGGRYHSSAVNGKDEYEQVAAYIFNNPVRAGIVEVAEDYEWSNFNDLLLGYEDDAEVQIIEVSTVERIITITRENSWKNLSRAQKERLEIFPKARITDDELLTFLNENTSREKLVHATELPASEQQALVEMLLDYGSNTSQISRVTGLTRRQISLLRID